MLDGSGVLPFSSASGRDAGVRDWAVAGAALGVDPLSLLSGQLDHRPELSILLALLDEVTETASTTTLRRWVRAAGPQGRPIDALVARDFASFEDQVATLRERGFVIRGGGGAG